MRTLLASTPLLALLLTQPARAEPAHFRQGILTLPEVLVQRDQGPALYLDVELQLLPDGSFELLRWDSAPLADIESLSVEQEQYPPGTVVVIVQGFKSMGCIGVEPARVSRTGNTFHFAFVEEPPADNVRCMAGPVPLSTEFGIQTGGLEPGDYTIVYGELHVQFHLHATPRG